MSALTDRVLMQPEHIAQQIENAYKEGVADAHSDPEAMSGEYWHESVAKIMSDAYRKIPKEGATCKSPNT